MKKITQYVWLLSGCLLFTPMVNAEEGNDALKSDNLRALLAEEKILADPADAQGNQRFGNAVSISGNRALVGASRDNLNGNTAGSAYLFEYIDGQWIQTQKIVGDDTVAGDGFGYAVSLGQDRLLVGAYSKVIDGVAQAGAVYVFDYSNGVWDQTARLTVSPPLIISQFGYSVSLFGDKALIGAPSNGTGVAHVFEFDDETLEWFQATTLSAIGGAFGDRFGQSVSLYQNRGLIGANQTQPGDNGAAYVFESLLSNNQQTKLTASDGEANDGFGISVSLYEDRALVGAAKDDDISSNDSGSAYVFDLDTVNDLWLETEKLTADDAAAGDEFGNSVSLHGDRVLIGAWGDDDNGANSGSAYLYDFDGTFWNQSEKLTASDGSSIEEYGRAVFLTADWAIMGATKDSDNGSAAGAAYAYREDVIFISGF